MTALIQCCQADQGFGCSSLVLDIVATVAFLNRLPEGRRFKFGTIEVAQSAPPKFGTRSSEVQILFVSIHRDNTIKRVPLQDDTLARVAIGGFT